MPSIKAIAAVDRGSVVVGLRDIKRKLLSLSNRLGVNVFRRGLLAGAGVIRAEARRLAPQPPARSKRGNVRRGLLAKQIAAATNRTRGTKTEYRATVTVRRPKAQGDIDEAELKDGGKAVGGPNPRAYAHLVEFGTDPHALGRGSVRERVVKGRVVRGVTIKATKKGKQTGAMHPGTQPQLVFTRAFAAKREEAVAEAARVVRVELAKELGERKR